MSASTNTNTTTTSNPSSDGTFTLLLFASASTYTGGLESLTLDAPLSLPQLFSTLEAKFPGITAKVLRSCAVTVNLEYVDVDVDVPEPGAGGAGGEDGEVVMIRPGDEVGIIPPVSSG